MKKRKRNVEENIQVDIEDDIPEDMKPILEILVNLEKEFKRIKKEEEMRLAGFVFLDLFTPNHLMSLKETAKLFHMSKKELILALIDMNLLYKNEKGDLMPNEDGRGYFRVKESGNGKNGESKVQILTTPQGRHYVLLRLMYG